MVEKKILSVWGCCVVSVFVIIFVIVKNIYDLVKWILFFVVIDMYFFNYKIVWIVWDEKVISI